MTKYLVWGNLYAIKVISMRLKCNKDLIKNI